MYPYPTEWVGDFLMIGNKQAQASVWFLLPAAALLVGLLPLPYGYYTFLRIAVCLSAVIAAYLAFKVRSQIDAYAAISLAVAIAFNPIVPIYLNKGLWSIIDVVAAIWFALLIFRGSRRQLLSSMDSDK